MLNDPVWGFYGRYWRIGGDMRGTIFIIATTFAAYLYDQGYWAIALALALTAFGEAVVGPWWRKHQRAKKRRQRVRRERDGVANGAQKSKKGWAAVWHMTYYGQDKPE